MIKTEDEWLLLKKIFLVLIVFANSEWERITGRIYEGIGERMPYGQKL